MAGRVASLLPTIKCSSCGRQVEISMMGEHICGGDAEPSEPEPEPSTFGKILSYATGISATTSSSSNAMDEGRPARVPPQVDTTAANRNFYRAGQLTPVSTSSGSQSVSPRTPLGMRNGAGSRSGDDYFAPKIAGQYSPSQQRRPGGYGGFSGDDDADSYQPASSPNKAAPSLLQRMNTIAPGPFDMGRKPGNTRNAFPSRNGESDSSISSSDLGSGNDRYGTSPSNSLPLPSPRGQRQNGYGGFDSPSSPQNSAQQDDSDFEPQAFTRAGTFPRLRENLEPPMRTPSAPGTRGERRRQQSSGSAYDYSRKDSYNNHERIPSRLGNPAGTLSNRPSMGPDTSRPPPPRTSLVRPRTAGRDSNNVPQINLAAEFGIGNPYHSSSDSMSSTVSSLDRPNLPFSSSTSSFSSASSFSTSASASSTVDRSRPKPNNNSVTQLDELLDGMQSMNMSPDERDMPAQQPPPSRKTGSLRAARPPPLADTVNKNNNNMPSDREYEDSRTDRFPAPLTPTVKQARASQNRRPVSRDRDDGGYGNMQERSRARDPSAAPMPAPASAPVPSRGVCKACGKPITGKSVSSADGRLTGRYHKACFVCTTCSKPFSSATFYVHDDKPYCEQHYHEVNGSLCGTCGLGIEGQYLADETDQKYHPRCFVCADCGNPLRDGYFEVNGQVYCERDAWKRVQQTYLSSAPTAPTPMQGDKRQPPRGMPRGPPSGLPAGPGSRRGGPRPNIGPGPGLLPPMAGGGRMGMGGPGGLPGRPYGLPNGNRLAPRPRMEKRMTRLGMM